MRKGAVQNEWCRDRAYATVAPKFGVFGFDDSRTPSYGGAMVYVSYVHVVISTFALVGLLAALLAVYQIRDQLETVVKLLEEKNK